MQEKKKNPWGNSVKDLAEAFLDLKKFENMDPNPEIDSWYIIYFKTNL